MSFTIFFPRQRQEDGAYKYLDTEEEVYEVILDEVRQSISDMGSDGYDPSDYIAEAEADLGIKYDPDVDDEEHWRIWQLAADKAIEHQVTMWAPGIHKELWVRYRSTEYGTQDTAVDDTTYAKLPDGVTIALKEVLD